MALLDYKAVKKQSEAVYGQFADKWHKQSAENAKLNYKHPNEFWNIGLGKNLVICAMGASLERDMPLLKQYRDRVDIMVCDKAFGKFIDAGITPDYVMLADANISYEMWLKPYIEHTKNVKLISTVYANPEWTKNWKGPLTFYMNKDAIGTEKTFLPVWGDKMRIIPASSNVGNAMVVFMLGCDDNQRINFAGYQNYYLTGFDYSWQADGNYYAFENPIPKRHYMNHRTLLDYKRNICHTSENLVFSAKWLMQYLEAFKPPVVNCTEQGLLETQLRGSLAEILPKLTTDKSIPNRIRNQFNNLLKMKNAFAEAEAKFNHDREVLIWQ